MGRIHLGRDVETERKLFKCTGCGLLYFSHVPAKNLLLQMFDQTSLTERWEGVDRLAFRRGLAAVRQYVPSGTAVLDIGAHTGGFLQRFGDGWRKVALEPMINSSRAIGEVEMLNGFVEEADLPESAFDCVSAFDVIEHLYDPDQALARITTSLKPHGILVLETGNAGCLFARLLGAGWYYLSYVDHFQAFSRRSLRELFDAHGLEVLAGVSTFHDAGRWNDRFRAARLTVIYSVLTMGREPRLWRLVSSSLRPRLNAVPPSTVSLEPDHLFFVARKQAA